MKRKIFTIIVFVLLGSFYIYLKRNVNPWVDLTFKILPTVLLSVMLCLSLKYTKDKASVVLPLCALAFSMLGDSAGEVPFLHGDLMFMCMMGFFAFAHIFYTASFMRFAGKKVRIVMPFLISLYAVVFYVMVSPFLPHNAVRIGVAVYLLIILFMALTASIQDRKNLVFFVFGAVMFMISDSILAYCRFVGPLPGRDIMVMGTYYLAQLMLNLPLINDRAEC